jgi:hypothetical protein
VIADEVVIDPAALDHDLQHAGEERRVAAWLDRQVQVAGSGDRRDAWILDDDPGALLACLPDVVRGDRRALGDVRPGDPDHLGADHVRPGIRRAIDAERLLVRGTGADHAQPSVVVDERRLEADARELPEEVGLLRRQTGAAQHADCTGAMGLLDASDLAGDAGDGVAVRHRAEAGRRRRVAPQRRREAIGVRALEIALHALRTEHAAVEGKILPGLEADDLVVAHLELNAALLPAEAAVRLHQAIGFGARREPYAGHRRQVRTEAFDDAKGIDRNFRHCAYPASRWSLEFKYWRHKAPCANPNSARRQRGQTS